MSREFGSYESGYMHNKIRSAAEDCSGGDDELTRRFGVVLEKAYNIAYGISSSEAGDWDEAQAIMRAIDSMNELKESIRDMEDYLKPFRRLAEEVIRKRIREEEQA